MTRDFAIAADHGHLVNLPSFPILPIAFEPIDRQSDKLTGAIPPAIEPERGMVESGVCTDKAE